MSLSAEYEKISKGLPVWRLKFAGFDSRSPAHSSLRGSLRAMKIGNGTVQPVAAQVVERPGARAISHSSAAFLYSGALEARLETIHGAFHPTRVADEDVGKSRRVRRHF